MNEPKTAGNDCDQGSSASLDSRLTLIGTVTFLFGHAVAFFFHVLWPAAIALVSVSGRSWGISMSSGLNAGIQTLSLVFLIGAWVFFIRKIRNQSFTIGRLGLGAILATISLFVFYQWSLTMNLFLGGV